MVLLSVVHVVVHLHVIVQNQSLVQFAHSVSLAENQTCLNMCFVQLSRHAQHVLICHSISLRVKFHLCPICHSMCSSHLFLSNRQLSWIARNAISRRESARRALVHAVLRLNVRRRHSALHVRRARVHRVPRLLLSAKRKNL